MLRLSKLIELHGRKKKLASGEESEIAVKEAEAIKALPDKSRMKSAGAPAKLIESTPASCSVDCNSQQTAICQISAGAAEVAGAEGTSSQNCRESSSSISDNILDLSEYDMCDEKDLQEIRLLEESFTTTIEAQVRSMYNYFKQALFVDPETPRFEKRLAYKIPRSRVEIPNQQPNHRFQKVLNEPLEFQESHFTDNICKK